MTESPNPYAVVTEQVNGFITECEKAGIGASSIYARAVGRLEINLAAVLSFIQVRYGDEVYEDAMSRVNLAVTQEDLAKRAY